MKPNAIYYYITALAYFGFGLFIYFGKIGDNLIRPDYRIWICLIFIGLGIFRAVRGYQLHKSEKR